MSTPSPYEPSPQGGTPAEQPQYPGQPPYPGAPQQSYPGQAQYPAQPQYSGQQQYPGAPQPPKYAGSYDQARYRTMSIVGFVLSLLGPLTVAGLVVSIIALVKSKKANEPTGFALAGTIIGALGTVVMIVIGALVVAAVMHLASVCSDLGDGTHYVDGVTYTCGYSS